MTRSIQQKLLSTLALLIITISMLSAETLTILQSRIVTGKIVNARNETMPGVSILQKGTTIGAMTDADGNFSIEISGSDATLIFSSIGYKKQEVVVGDKTVINATLEDDVVGLDEVIVVGYGEQKRSNVTGAIASVNVSDMSNKTQLRLDQALQGLAAGVTVARNGGAPGEKPTIHIRGAGSLGVTEPLWIVDGVRMDPGNQFDVDDVESIEVLKDGASAAIYGSKAAHGVILVTTKRGKGALQVSYKTSISKRQAVNLPEFLNSADFVKYKKLSRLNAGQNPEPSWDNYEHDTDWINAFYAGSGQLWSHDLSVSRGDENFNYFLSIGHDDEDGILIDNSFKRYSLRLNSDAKITKWLKFGESILLSQVKENPIGNNNENYSGGIPYRSIPIMPIRDEENKYGGWGRAPVYFQGPNPVATQYQQHETRTYNRLDGNIYLEATPLKGLQLRGTLGYNYMGFIGEKFDEAFDYGSFANPINALTYAAAQDQGILGNLVATYSRAIGKHDVKLMLGTEASKFESKHFNVTRTGFPIDVAWSFNLATGSLNNTDRFNVYEARVLSYFGRFNYSYNEKYLIEANFRKDASAPKFGPANIWGTFPSFSAGWRISQEDFFRDVPYITNLKLRAGIGTLGSDRIGDYIYLKTYTSQFSTYSFDQAGANKVSGFFISRFPNEEVTWEEVNVKNVALDIKAFENKVWLNIDYFIKDTKRLLYPVPIPASVGIAVHNFNPVNPELNIGTMQNKGLEFDFGYTNTFNKLAVTINGNMTFMRNEMKSLRADEYVTGGDGGGQIGGMTRTQAGYPMSSFYGYVVQQMLNTPYEIFAINTYASDGTYQEAGTAPGDFMYKDLSGPNGVPDGEITPQYDRTYIGNPWPKMTYALNVSMVYNGIIDLSLQFQGVQGVDIFNASKAYSRNFFGDNNTTTDIYEAWTPDHYTNNPRVIASDPNGNWSRPSTYFVEDGSYLKLRNIQLGVNVPKKIISKVRINKLRVYANANNLLTFTKYSGLDPEVAGSNIGRGIDYGQYPQVRTYSAGLEIQF